MSLVNVCKDVRTVYAPKYGLVFFTNYSDKSLECGLLWNVERLKYYKFTPTTTLIYHVSILLPFKQAVIN